MSRRNGHALRTMLDYQQYRLPEDEKERSAPFRVIAHYLNWAAEHYPHLLTPWKILARISTNRTSTPRDDSADVALIKKTAARVRQLLITNYERELVNQRGVGARATVGSLDALKSRMPARQRQFESAAAGLQATAGLVNLSEIPTNAETKPLKEWFASNVQPSLKQLDSLQKRLALPPALVPQKEQQK